MSTKLTIFVLLVLATSALTSTRRLAGAQTNLSGSKLTNAHRNSATKLMKSLGETGVGGLVLLHYGTQVVAGENVTMVWRNVVDGRAFDHQFLCVRVYKNVVYEIKPEMTINKWSHTEADAKTACNITRRRLVRGGSQSNLSGSEISKSQLSSATELMTGLKESRIRMMTLLHYGTQVVAGKNISMVWKNNALGRESTANENFLCARVYKHFSASVKPNMTIHTWFKTEKQAMNACNFSKRRLVGGGSQSNLSGSEISKSQLSSATELMTGLKESRIGMMQLLHYGTQVVAGKNISMVWRNKAIGRESTANENFLCARVYKHFSASVKPKMSKHTWFKTEKQAMNACNFSSRRLQAGPRHNYTGADLTIQQRTTATGLMTQIGQKNMDKKELMSYGTQKSAGNYVFLMVWKNNELTENENKKYLSAKVTKGMTGTHEVNLVFNNPYMSEQEANRNNGF
jgi:hypothetical protein